MIKVQYNEADLKNYITHSDRIGRRNVATLSLLYIMPESLGEDKEWGPLDKEAFEIMTRNLHHEINEFSADSFIGHYDHGVEYTVVAEPNPDQLRRLLAKKKFDPVAVVVDESFRRHPEEAEAIKPVIRGYADSKGLPIFIHTGDSESLDHEAIIDMIKNWGADTAFTYPGRFDGILSVVDGMQGYLGRAARDLLGSYPHIDGRIIAKRFNHLPY